MKIHIPDIRSLYPPAMQGKMELAWKTRHKWPNDLFVYITIGTQELKLTITIEDMKDEGTT